MNLQRRKKHNSATHFFIRLLEGEHLQFVLRTEAKLIGHFQLHKSKVQTAFKGRAFFIDIGTFVPETIVSQKL
jgi:hypothetical protein